MTAIERKLTPENREGNEVLTPDELPLAPFYVTALDTFMSGWGPARDKKNRVVIPCASEEEAAVVAANARGRSEMLEVCIHTDKPSLKGAGGPVLFSLLTKQRAASWFEPDTWVELGDRRDDEGEE